MTYTNIEKRRAWDRADWLRNPKRRAARNARRRGEHQQTNLANRYGLSIFEYLEMTEAQAGICACCGNPPTKRRLSVDHDHTNGRVRGLVCERCNSAIAILEHPNLPKWQAYLKLHATRLAGVEFPTADEIASFLGTRNWVVTRRTSKVIARYGADVVCLSPQKFKKMQQQILATRAAT